MRHFTTLSSAREAATRMWRDFSGTELQFLKNIPRDTPYLRTEDAERQHHGRTYRGELLILETEDDRFSVRLSISLHQSE
jgi:hypothetical protein